MGSSPAPQLVRFTSTSAPVSQAATVAEATPPAPADSPVESKEGGLTLPSAPAIGVGLFVVLGALAGEWIYMTDEFIEMIGFWSLFYLLYKVAGPVIGSTFDANTESIRAAELDKLKAARDALGLEQLAIRYHPALVEAQKLVSSELSSLQQMEPSVLEATKQRHMKALLDMHMEAAGAKDQAVNELIAKRFRRAVLKSVAAKK